MCVCTLTCGVTNEGALCFPDQPFPQGGGPRCAHHWPPPVQDGPPEAVQAHEEHPPLQRMIHSSFHSLPQYKHRWLLIRCRFPKRLRREVEIFLVQIYKTSDHVRLINMHQNSAYLCRIASDSIWLTCFTPERFQNEAPWIILAPEMSLLFTWVINLTRSLVWNSRQRIHISLRKMNLRVREVKEGSFWQIMLLCTWIIFCKQKRNRHFIPFLRICYSLKVILNMYIFSLQPSVYR